MAKKNSAIIWIEYATARVALGLMGVLSREAAIRFAIFILGTTPFILRNLWRTGMRNLEIAFPAESVAWRASVLNGTFENLGRVLGELSQFHKYTRDDLARFTEFDFDQETKTVYEKNKSEGRGVLLVTGHMGNWEMLVFAFAALYEPISYLARPLDNPKIEEMLTRFRIRFGNTPINKSNSAMLAIKILREGGGLGILSDVNAHPKEGVFVPFFGVPACTPTGAAMIAIRSNALIFPVVCVWEKEIGRYKLVHGDLLAPANTGNRRRDILETTAAYTAELERIIRQYPGQWMWIHKRWKTRPTGETDIY
ncbi:MAG: lysophospholipid acyltransferase family protein [Pyrinomonadaceae bacterium]